MGRCICWGKFDCYDVIGVAVFKHCMIGWVCHASGFENDEVVMVV